MNRWLWLFLLILPAGSPCPAAESQVGGRTSPDGKEEIIVDLPGSEHLKNVAGKDGSGDPKAEEAAEGGDDGDDGGDDPAEGTTPGNPNGS